jgi:hypothetical protein
VLEADNAVSVSVRATSNATTAEYALGGVSYDGGADLVNGNLGLGALEHIVSCTSETSNVEKLALLVLVAGLAVHGVVGEKKLNGSSSCRYCLGRGDGDLHTLVYGIYAGCYESACTGCLNETNTARTSVALSVVECAKSGDLISASLCSLKYGQSLFNLVGNAFDFNIN